MTAFAVRPKSRVETRPGPPLQEDAKILQRAIRDSVSTSPEAFLKTLDYVNEMPLEYWESEIGSSTWAVIERGEDVVGVAVARLPNREMDHDIDPDKARFIESVWIAPELRGHQIGERLVRFLFEVECAKNPQVKQFFLWVFEENYRAIRLYDRMGFSYTDVKHLVDRGGRTELRYKYRLMFDIGVVRATKTAVNKRGRRKDQRKRGLRYRILGGNFS
jgi:ribosomal protein S18 acetylase RimI-like enzyme